MRNKYPISQWISRCWNGLFAGLAAACSSPPALFLAVIATIFVLLTLHSIFLIIGVIALLILFLTRARKDYLHSRIYILSLAILLWGGFSSSIYQILNKLIDWHYFQAIIVIIIGYIFSYFFGGTLLNRIESRMRKLHKPQLLRYIGVFCALFMLSFGIENIFLSLPWSSIQYDIKTLGNQVSGLFPKPSTASKSTLTTAPKTTPIPTTTPMTKPTFTLTTTTTTTKPTTATTTTTITAIAATIYVPDDQRTIQAAVNVATPGNTIIVRDGTYIENVYVNKSLTIQSMNGSNSTIVQATAEGYSVFSITANYVTLRGFTLIGGRNSGVLLHSTQSCYVVDNICKRGERGINLYSSSQKNIIENNICVENSYCGIQLASDCSYNILRGNNCTGRGIEVVESSNNNVFENNTCSVNKETAILLVRSSGNTLRNNNFMALGERGLVIAESSNNIIFLNNFKQNTNNTSYGSTTIWNSSEQITYIYNNKTHTNYLGNYCSDYTGSDANGDGIGDTPNRFSSESDNFPLIKPVENYIITSPFPTLLPR